MIYHAVYRQRGATPEVMRRNSFAESTYPVLYGDGVIPLVLDSNQIKYSFDEIRDGRYLPALNDMLDLAVVGREDDDVILFANCDICFCDASVTVMKQGILRNPACVAHRHNIPNSVTRPYSRIELIGFPSERLGVDTLLFSVYWWRGMRPFMPRLYVGARRWDILVKLLVMLTANDDPVLSRITYHEEHGSEWRSSMGQEANRVNHRRARKLMSLAASLIKGKPLSRKAVATGAALCAAVKAIRGQFHRYLAAQIVPKDSKGSEMTGSLTAEECKQLDEHVVFPRRVAGGCATTAGRDDGSIANTFMTASLFDFFPAFDTTHIDYYRAKSTQMEREELSSMFEVLEILNPKCSDHIVSTSLYCRPHHPELAPHADLSVTALKEPHASVRGHGSWWATYFEPLLRVLPTIAEPWIVRIHLAHNLRHLAPFLNFRRCEIRIMKHDSEGSIPGMLWRYLPIEEDCLAVARGADDLILNAKEAAIMHLFLETDAYLLRFFNPADVNSEGQLSYRPIPGPITTIGLTDLRFRESAEAWIWYQQRGFFHATTFYPPAGKHLVKVGMDHWTRYGQDEQFLSHWLYPLVLKRGLFSAVPAGRTSFLINVDLATCIRAGTQNIVVRPDVRAVH